MTERRRTTRLTMVICAMAVSVAAGTLADPAPAHAVHASTMTDSCVQPSDGLARRAVTIIREIVTGTGSLDVSRRSTFSLPAMPADSVTLVQDPAVCARASAVYTRGVRGAAAAPVFPIMVIRVGSNRFVVADTRLDPTVHFASCRWSSTARGPR